MMFKALALALVGLTLGADAFAATKPMTMGIGGFSHRRIGGSGVKATSLFSIFKRNNNNLGSGNGNGMLGGGNGGGKNNNKNKPGHSMSDDSDGSKPAPNNGGLWDAYNAALESNPLIVKCLTSLVGFSLGDILAQLFVEKVDKFDWKRLARLASFGFLLHGSMGHFFYSWIDTKLPGVSARTVATKVGIDQVLFNPVFASIFFTYMGLTNGDSFADVKAKIKRDIKTAVVGSWTVWVPAHTINFRFIQPQQRLLYINTIQIGYNIFLSFLGNK